MPGRDMTIDPLTRDYVSDGAGGYKRTTGAETSVYRQLMDDLGKWVGHSETGSRLFELARAKSLEGRAVRDVQNIIERALQPLVASGRIGPPEFHGERDVTRVLTSTTIRDLTLGQSIVLADILPTLP